MFQETVSGQEWQAVPDATLHKTELFNLYL